MINVKSIIIIKFVYMIRRTNGGIRPTLGPPRPNNRHLNVARNKRLPPRGMYVNHDDLQSIASGSNGQGETVLSAMDDEVVSLKCKVCVAFLNLCIFFFSNCEF